MNATERCDPRSKDVGPDEDREYIRRMRGELLEAERVHSIVGAFFSVYNYYRYGLNEAIYSRALEYELTDRGHEVVRELMVEVKYKGRHVSWQRLDMVVDGKVIVENKAREGPSPKFHRFIDFPKSPRP